MRIPHMKMSRAAWILVILLGAAAGVILLHDPDARDGSVLSQEMSGRSSLNGSLADLTAGPGISANPSVTRPRSKTALAATTSPPPASDNEFSRHDQTRSGASKAGPGGPARSRFLPALEHSRPTSPLEGRPRPRSPLERSPGYYPPADPESMSVVTGRREAPEVSLELAGGAPSRDALAREILTALHARDESALAQLQITRREFEILCWPEVPESRPVTHISAEDAWSFSTNASHAGRGRMVSLYGGRDLEFLRLESEGSFPYRNFVRHYGMALLVKDRGTGEILRIVAAPSWIERHGRFKILIFKD
ncbi:MAG TPA: hypothetical protein VET83_04655 [Candidatus Dormibacteraeota bacterium]|nr:hypothetical protein [Candidatus Dormibacteraeota bacterium]